MKRLALLLPCLGLGACLDFRRLVSDCSDGGGVCTVDGGGATGGGRATGGGGSNTGGGLGGGTPFDDVPLAPGGVTPDCDDAGVGVTRNPNSPQTAFCFNGFTWVSPLPQGNDLRAVWGSSPVDVWAGGQAGMLMHFDGGGWTSFQGRLFDANGGSVESIVGLGTGPVALAVTGPGVTSRVYTWDDVAPGGPWHLFSSHGAERLQALAARPDTSDGGLLLALSNERLLSFDTGGGETTQYQFPAAKQPNQWGRVGAIALSDSGGCAFVTRESSTAGPCQLRDCAGGQLLNAGTSKGNCSSVWFQGQALRWALDYDLYSDTGHVLALDPSGQSTPLAAFAQPNGVGLVVGENRAVWNALDGGYRPVDPNPVQGRRFDLPLLAVWTSADGGAVAVGGGGFIAMGQGAALTWRSGGVTLDVYGIALEPTRELVAGSGGLLWVLDGGAATGSTTIRDLAAEGDGGYLLVDEDGNVRPWSLGRDPGSPRYTLGGGRLHGLHRQGVDDLVVVGGVGTEGHVATWNGAGFAPETPDDAGLPWKTLWKVHGRGGRAWAVGEELTLLERAARGQPWVRNPPPVASGTSLYGVWMESADAGTGWAVGGGGPYRIIDGGLTDVQPVVQYPLNFFDVWGFDADDVWAVGDDGHVLHLHGGTWERLESGCHQALERVRGRQYADGSREVFIGGRMGAVLRYRYRP